MYFRGICWELLDLKLLVISNIKILLGEMLWCYVVFFLVIN